MAISRIKTDGIEDDAVTSPKIGHNPDFDGQYVRVPHGTTAERPGSPAAGFLRFNTTIGTLEQWNTTTNAWQAIDSPPIISSSAYAGSLTASDPAGGETITLTGSNFKAGATVTVGGTTAPSVSVISSTSITFTTPVKTAGDYDVVVINSNGLQASLTNGISYNGTPAFTTAAGNVGSIAEDIAMSTITIVAAEPDGGTLAYSVTSGALPTGVSLGSANGQLTGTPNANITSNTTFNFTVTATDDENQTNSRAFNLIVLRPIYATSIDNSLRLVYSDNSSLTKTWGTNATDGTRGTMSAWVKRCILTNGTGNHQYWFHSGTGTDNSGHMDIKFDNNDTISMGRYSDTPFSGTAVHRDTTAWMHIVVVWDTTDASAANNKVVVYVNGTALPGTYANISQNDVLPWTKNGNALYIGKHATVNRPLDGYLADIHLIDGQALAPTDFAEEYYGVWVPKAYSGTYGNNGFKLDFADSSDLGKDSSQDYTLVTGGSTTYGGGTTNYTNPDDAFDGLNSTGMNRSGTTGIIEITPSSAVTPIYHQITNTNSGAYTDASRPRNVQLEGSNDGGSTWTVIDTITQTPTGAESTTSSSSSNSTSYTKLRLNITTNNGGSNTRFSEYKIISSEAGGGLGINNLTASGLDSRDSTPDSPTTNFATLNAIAPQFGNVSNGNLSWSASVAESSMSTIAMSSGKWYWEWRVTSNNWYFYLVNDSNIRGASSGSNTVFGVNGAGSHAAVNCSTQTNSFSSSTGGDVFSCAYDADLGQAEIYQNNSLVLRFNTFTIDGPYFATFDRQSSSNTGVTHTVNFGQDSTFDGNETVASNADSNGIGEFHYAVPSGYLALCAKNLPESTINTTLDDRPEDYFNTVLYTGTGAAVDINTVGFQPDLVWGKKRSAPNQNNWLIDSVRGAGVWLSSDSNGSEGTEPAGSSFDADGFNTNNNSLFTYSGGSYVLWAWKAGGAPTSTNSAGAGNVPTSSSVMIDGVASTSALAGTIAADKISANTKSKFSIVSFTGNGSGGATVAHGLGVTPTMILLKSRSIAGGNWRVYHQGVGTSNTLFLNNTNAQAADADRISGVSSTTFTLSSGNGAVNGSGATYIAYCFADVEGFSKFGSYTGNSNTDGPFVYTGFKPAFVITKRTNSASNWAIHDDKRSPYNVTEATLYANAADAEVNPSTEDVDFSSNGFKMRGTTTARNSSGSYIYMAFAEDPFKYSEAK